MCTTSLFKSDHKWSVKTASCLTSKISECKTLKKVKTWRNVVRRIERQKNL